MKTYYKSDKIYKYVSIGLIIFIYFMYVINNSKIMTNTIIKSFLWLSISIAIIFIFPSVHPKSKLKYREQLFLFTFICGIIYIVIYIGSGIFLGYGKSPYSTGFINISLNLFIFISPIIGREHIRSYLLNNERKHRYSLHIIITILMIATEISIIQISNLKTIKELVMYSSQIMAPIICNNIFASYLVTLAGSSASIIYLSLITSIELISPVLPDLQWLTRGVIGICLPMFSYLAINSYYQKLVKEYKPYKQKNESAASWIITSIVCIGLIWFSVGVFPMYPSVIVTGSMIPVINPGDIVIIDKIQTRNEINNLKIGDVIQFKRGDILIVHRIIELVTNKNNGLTYYRTKGDNNSSNDSELVNPNNIKGSLHTIIPKLGWPSLILKNNDNIPLDDIEF